jgi:iron complex outermembrane receptor protein
LTLQGSFGYNDTSITSFPGASADIGNRTPQVYPLTSSFSVDYTHPLSDSFALLAHVDWSHRGDVYWDLANTLRTPPKDFLNTRVSVDFGRRYSIALVGRNITDERTPSAVGANALASNETLASYNEPRQWGMELQARF